MAQVRAQSSDANGLTARPRFVNPTNGVQPLWGWILTALAQVMSWLGLRNADLFARIDVALAATLRPSRAGWSTSDIVVARRRRRTRR